MEANRRAGGRKTQRSIVKSWNVHFEVSFFFFCSMSSSLVLMQVFQKEALAAGKL